MPLLPLDKVTPGMRTAAPIADAGGALLVREGAELTAELIGHLRNRKITVVDVAPQGAGAGAPAAARPADLQGSEAALAHAFERVLGNEVMRALHDAAASHLRTRTGRTV